MAERFKWVAFSHDTAYEVNSEHCFATKDECYNDMRNTVLSKMKWNTEYKEDFGDGTTAISYKVWFEQGMIVHQSYSGTYVYLIVGEYDNPTYYDVFNTERVEYLKSIDMIDWAAVATVESYQARHAEGLAKKQTYEVTIRTTNTRTYTVSAKSEDEAVKWATDHINEYEDEGVSEETEVLNVTDYA